MVGFEELLMGFDRANLRLLELLRAWAAEFKEAGKRGKARELRDAAACLADAERGFTAWLREDEARPEILLRAYANYYHAVMRAADLAYRLGDEYWLKLDMAKDKVLSMATHLTLIKLGIEEADGSV